MRVRIELLDVLCRDPEDVMAGGDELYLVGGVSDGVQSRPVLTSPMTIGSNQRRQFRSDQSVLFDADVPSGRQVHIGLHAFDEDFAKDWGKYSEYVKKLADSIAGQLDQVPRDPRTPSGEPDPAQVAASLLRAGVFLVDFFAARDQDDHLGSLAVDVPMGAYRINGPEWIVKGQWFGGLFGWSNWDYAVRYRIAQAGVSAISQAARYGTQVKMMHQSTTRTLHSHALPYAHPGTSGQQQVTAFEWLDDNDWWRVKGPHGQPENHKIGQPVQHGDIVRLEHVLTKRNLHSHGGIQSPLTKQQEVTCFGGNSIGDSNDNWRVEVEGGGTWESGKRLRLIHVNTNHALHSHYWWSHPSWTAGQQEVTAFASRDDNDWWSLFEVR